MSGASLTNDIEMDVNIWFWIGFLAFVLTMLALDLGVFHREAHEVKPREAGGWVSLWVSLSPPCSPAASGGMRTG